MAAQKRIGMYRYGVKTEVVAVVDEDDLSRAIIRMIQMIPGADSIFQVHVRSRLLSGFGVDVGDDLKVYASGGGGGDDDPPMNDGTIVLIELNGRSMLAAYFRDEHDEAWLIPGDEQLQPVSLSGEEAKGVCIFGRVVGIVKAVAAMPYKECKRRLEQRDERVRQRPTDEQIGRAVRQVAPHVRVKRHWYAVFRVLADRGAVREGGYADFVELVNRLLPGNGYELDSREISRMALGTMNRPVSAWSEAGAPVKGKTFQDYCNVARLTAEALDGRP